MSASRTNRILGTALAAAAATMWTSVAKAAAPDGEQSRFAASFVAALRSADASRLQSLAHSATKGCESAANSAYFDAIWKDYLRDGRSLTGAYAVEGVQPAGKAPPLGLVPPDGFAYPIPPTQQIQINAVTKGGDTIPFVSEIARDGAAWRFLVPCPNEKGLAFFHQQQAQGAALRAAGVKIVASMSPQLRGELQRLVDDWRWMEAVDRYRAATGADLKTAMEVIDALQPT